MGPVPNGFIFSQRVLVPMDTGCQPVVAGSPAGKIFAPRSAEATPNYPGLGTLPRPAGWQPALPRTEESRAVRAGFDDDHRHRVMLGMTQTDPGGFHRTLFGERLRSAV